MAGAWRTRLEEPMIPTHLSPSGLATWRQCGLKWWHHYVDEWPGYPPSEAMLRGTIVHAAVEALFPVGPVKPPTKADIDYHLSVAYDAVDKTPITSDPAEFYETCRASLHSAVERLSRLDEVLLVETELRAWGDSGLEFYGFVDMVARKGGDWHRRWGITFFYAMAVVALTAIGVGGPRLRAAVRSARRPVAVAPRPPEPSRRIRGGRCPMG